jgi:hypothetical protein
MPVHNALYDGQPHAGALEVLTAVQALKNSKEFPGVFHVKPGAVVLHAEYDPVFFLP